MCHVLRLGSPLCVLYNQLIPVFITPSSPIYADIPAPNPIPYDLPNFMDNPDGVRNWAKRSGESKSCQKLIAQFCMAMKQRREEGRWHNDASWALHELWGKSTGDDNEVESYDSTGLMKVFQTVEYMLDCLPNSALSPLSPTPTNSFAASTHPFAAMTPLAASTNTARQSYEVPYSASSSTTLVNPMLAQSNGVANMDDSAGPGPSTVEQLKSSSDPALQGNAFKTVEELVRSERSYVQEMEILERCSAEIVAAELINPETVFSIFSNLRSILDFQRKFLIKLETEYEPIEEQGCQAWTEGRWGRPFVDMEKEFECYGPYCANYLDAIALINSYMPYLMAGQDLPDGQRPCLHPERELQAFMIKPIQRITKYGLLLDAILHATAKFEYPHRVELEAGLAAVRRIAADINETTAFKAKQATVRELVDRVDDWKGHDYERFGDLHLDDQFTVSKADSPRDYHVFLFDKMMLCCKEITPDKKSKGGKNSNMLRKDKTQSKSNMGAKPRLALKGRIFVSNITHAVLLPPSAGDQFAAPRVKIIWSVPAKNGDSEQDVEDSFVMSGRTEDQMKKWGDKVMELAAAAKKEQNDRHERARQNSRMSDPNRGPYWAQSSFAPPTPAQTHSDFFSPTTPAHSNYYLPDGDEDDELRASSGSLNGLAIYGVPGVPFPAGGNRRAQSQQSLPAIHQTELRTRAMTEDHNGPSITQWRQQAPPLPQAPHLPRITSGGSVAASDASWTSANGSRRPSQSRLGRPDEDIEEEGRGYGVNPGGPPPGAFARYESQRGMSRTPSQGVTGVSTGSGGIPPPPPLRSRSASSPNVYQQAQVSPIPPLPMTAATTNGGSNWPTQHSNNAPYPPSGSATSSSTGLGSTPGGTAYFTRRMSTGKRSSQESQTTETSETSSQSPRTPYTNATPGDLRGATPVSRQNSQEAPPSTVFVKVRSGDANFVIPVQSDVSYRTLYEKVVKKLRICSARHTAAGLDVVVKIKWLDSDGDEVVIKTDSDVQIMLLEAASEQIQLIAT